MHPYFISLLGGVLIGLAAAAMFFFNGRITGVSGILNNTIHPKRGDWLWRFCFILGLFCGGLVVRFYFAEALPQIEPKSFLFVILSGLLVGVGTVMSNGCTSGHGICGVARFSKRSLVATITFMIFGIFSATFLRAWAERFL